MVLNRHKFPAMINLLSSFGINKFALNLFQICSKFVSHMLQIFFEFISNLLQIHFKFTLNRFVSKFTLFLTFLKFCKLNCLRINFVSEKFSHLLICLKFFSEANQFAQKWTKIWRQSLTWKHVARLVYRNIQIIMYSIIKSAITSGFWVVAL